MQIRVKLTEDERREMRARAARLGVSGEEYATAAIRLGAQALLAPTQAATVPLIAKEASR